MPTTGVPAAVAKCLGSIARSFQAVVGSCRSAIPPFRHSESTWGLLSRSDIDLAKHVPKGYPLALRGHAGLTLSIYAGPLGSFPLASPSTQLPPIVERPETTRLRPHARPQGILCSYLLLLLATFVHVRPDTGPSSSWDPQFPSSHAFVTGPDGELTSRRYPNKSDVNKVNIRREG